MIFTIFLYLRYVKYTNCVTSCTVNPNAVQTLWLIPRDSLVYQNWPKRFHSSYLYTYYHLSFYFIAPPNENAKSQKIQQCAFLNWRATNMPGSILRAPRLPKNLPRLRRSLIKISHFDFKRISWSLKFDEFLNISIKISTYSLYPVFFTNYRKW